MALWKDILFGRPKGIRQSTYRRLFGLNEQAAMDEAEPYGEAGEPALNLGVEPPKDVTPPQGYEVVLHKDALSEGQVVEVIIAGNALAIAHAETGFYALDNACPRGGCALGEGSLKGHDLTCPTHGWVFDVRDGSCEISPQDQVPTFPVQVVGEGVCVQV